MSSFLTPADLHVSSSSFQTGPQGPLKLQNSGAIVFFLKTLHTLHNLKTRSIKSHLGHKHTHPVSCTPAKTSRQLWQITTLTADSENSWGSAVTVCSGNGERRGIYEIPIKGTALQEGDDWMMKRTNSLHRFQQIIYGFIEDGNTTLLMH